VTDDQLREVLTRAETIQRSTRVTATDSELEGILQAAAEVGYDRTAVEQALREKLVFPPAGGALTFAKSADEKFYVAEVLSSGPDGVRVKFLRGSEHTLAVDDLRPAAFLPGERVVCPWPMWGPWTCTVLSYDATARMINVSDGWGETRYFPISEVWLNRSKTDVSARPRARVSAVLIATGLGVGGLLGSILTALLLR